MRFIDACLFGDGTGGALIVTAQHHHFFETDGVEHFQGFRDFRAHGVANGEDAEHLARATFMRGVAEDGEGLSTAFDFG